jgi:acetyltransferase-like isoleucine patch superfamily enzyme
VNLLGHLGALRRECKCRAVRWILTHRIRARYPTLLCHPTAIWDYGYNDIDVIDIGGNVSVCAFAEIVVYRRSPFSSVAGGLSIGPGTTIGTGTNIRAAGGMIRIGARSAISQHCVLVAANHAIVGNDARVKRAWDESRTGVQVGDNVWVGASCVLLPGTKIEDNSVIAAGSVVRGTVPASELWGGVPARKLKNLG